MSAIRGSYTTPCPIATKEPAKGLRLPCATVNAMIGPGINTPLMLITTTDNRKIEMVIGVQPLNLGFLPPGIKIGHIL
ncbi:MAG: hypothetical protein KJ573_16595 [Proteobacteria bacterium]|nr:hypothetical protein [Pseudomonadota bacterium]